MIEYILLIICLFYVNNFLVFLSGEKWGKVFYFYTFTSHIIQLKFKVLMIRFLGNIEAKIDAKARVFVPVVFRKILQSSCQNILILRKDIFQDCLVLYPLQVWEEEVAKLRSHLNRWNKEQQAVFRQFVVDAERLEIDSNGRILVPRRYCQMVGISSDVRFLGVDNTIELWAKESLEKTLIPADDFSKRIQALMDNDPQNN
jgi:MraZ protein